MLPWPWKRLAKHQSSLHNEGDWWLGTGGWKLDPLLVMNGVMEALISGLINGWL